MVAQWTQSHEISLKHYIFDSACIIFNFCSDIELVTRVFFYTSVIKLPMVGIAPQDLAVDTYQRSRDRNVQLHLGQGWSCCKLVIQVFTYSVYEGKKKAGFLFRISFCYRGPHFAENVTFLHLDIPKGKSPSSVSFSCLFPACYFSPFIAISSVSCHRSSSRLPLSLPATQLYTWDLLECPPFIILSHHFIISSPSHQTSSLIFQIWPSRDVL